MDNIDNIIAHVKQSIINAVNNQSQLSNDILNMEGMSGHKTRHLYNNICQLQNSKYLEVGTWKGSSFISSMYKNTNTAGYCVDNWSEFSSPRFEFYKNLVDYLEPANNFKIIDKSCWDVDEKDIPNNINIYLYDGAHTYEDQKKAITYFSRFFAKYVIIMVDDWTCDWVDVKRGTIDGIEEAKLKVHLGVEIGLVNTNQHHCGGDTFWNGCGVFVCERED